MKHLTRKTMATFVAIIMLFSIFAGMPSVAADPVNDETLKGGEIITEAGSYQLDETATGLISIETTDPVVIIGNGAEWDADNKMTSTANNNLTFDCTNQAGVDITFKNSYFEGGQSKSLKDGSKAGFIGFKGAGNKLSFDGVSVWDYIAGASDPSAVHVIDETELTVAGDGTLYFFKEAQGAGFGGSTREVNGTLIFGEKGENGPNIFAKGTKQGALIGAGSNSASAGTPGPVTFNSGTYNLISNSKGAVIGGSAGSGGASAGTEVFVNGGSISINVDFSGAAVGGGGYTEGNDASGGNLYISGGSLRTYIDKNAAGNTTGWNGQKYTEGINDAAITANRLDSKENKQTVYRCALNTTKLGTSADTFDVSVDGQAFYKGGLHQYGFIQEGRDKGEQLTVSSTPSNWYKNGETNLYFYLTGKDHTLEVNGETFKVGWNEKSKKFTNAVKASDTTEDGLAYEVVDNKVEILGYEGDEDTVEIPSKIGGCVVTTIAADAFDGCDTVKQVIIPKGVTTIPDHAFDGCAEDVKLYVYTDSAANTYAKEKNMDYSLIDGKWDGTVIDVSWYDRDDKTFEIDSPAQFQGLAALVNGIYNKEITAIVGDDDLIQAVHVTGSGDSYWYGGEKDKYQNDFKDKTVKLTKDLDMGGEYNSDKWSGPVYMPIGGQYCMDLNDTATLLSASFNGTLDGQGHVVKNIYCNRYSLASNDYKFSQSVGLVGRLGSHDYDDASWRADSPSVKNLGITGYVYARRSVGGIVGKIGKTNKGVVIENSFNKATVHNTDAKGIGGIAGASWNGGVIRNCYNAGDITGELASCPVGGIGGSNEVDIVDCYNIGTITNKAASKMAMGIGTNNGGSYAVKNCYWLTGSATGGGYFNLATAEAAEKTAEEMKASDFAHLVSGSTRAFAADKDNRNNGYPVLRWENGEDTTIISQFKLSSQPKTLTYVEGQIFDPTGIVIKAVYDDGSEIEVTDYQIDKTEPLTVADKTVSVSGTYDGKEFSIPIEIDIKAKPEKKGDVYQINNEYELLWFSNQINNKNQEINAILLKDLDMSKFAYKPMGTSGIPYYGNFNGNNKAVTVSIEGTAGYQGLFGYAGNDATIKNVTVKGSVSGTTAVAGVVGYIANNAIVQNCTNEADITATSNNSGGIVGVYSGGKVLGNTNVGNVKGKNAVGGITGYASYVTAVHKDNKNAGTISGTHNVGGITGSGRGSVDYCFNLGKISVAEASIGNTRGVGGISGYHSNNGSVTNCYSNDDITVDKEEMPTGVIVGYLANGTVSGNSFPQTDMKEIGNKAGGTVEDGSAITEDQLAALQVDGKIASIGTVTLESEDAIEAAKAAYEVLTDEQKELVKNIEVLKDAESDYLDAYKAAVTAKPEEYAGVTDLSVYTPEGKAAVKAELEYLKEKAASAETLDDLKQIIEEVKTSIAGIKTEADQLAEKELEKAKQDAIDQLNVYVEKYEDYRIAQQVELLTSVLTGRTQIDKAEDKEAVDSILSGLVEKLDRIKTDKELTIEETKENLKKEVKASAASVSAKSVKVSWNRISEVTGYEVYKATGTSTDYKLIKKTSSLSLTDKSVKTGTTYKYKVRAYTTYDGETYTGGYSAVKSVKPIAAAPKVTVKAGKRLAKTSWKKVDGASGYQIYRSTKKSSAFKKIKTVSKNTTSYTNKKLTKGKVYYYQVRAYTKVSGKTIYGKFSTAKAVKIK